MYSHVVIMGRLTKDPELKKTSSNISVTSFSVAVSRDYVPKGGERQTDFFEVVAWRNTAEFISKYFKKGSMILVDGRMESRTYKDKNGNDRRVWELIADNVRFAGESAVKSESKSAKPYEPGTSEDFTEVEEDGDLPF